MFRNPCSLLKIGVISFQGFLHWKQDWIIRNAVVLVSLLAFFYSMWNFLIGRNYFTEDFYHLHLTFEHAYKSMDKDFSIPTWIPLFQSGKAAFGDMANSYSPFGIDFLLTYLLTKPLGLDNSAGLVLINTWRMVLLNVVFAFGCRQFAREILDSRYSADFVFLITLFVGGFFLPHRPIFIMCNIFSPWVLLYVTRIMTQGPERLLHNATGFTLATIASIFHQFNIQITLIWPYIVFYIIGLLFFGFGEAFFRYVWFLSKSWKAWRSTVLIIAITIAILTLSLLWQYQYFSDYNKRKLYDTESVEKWNQSIAYNFGDYTYERFEWQKLLSLFFPYPNTLEKVTNVTNGMGGIFMHNFQYLGILAVLLMMIGLVFGRNKYKLSVLFGIIFYILFSAVDKSPIFATALNLHYPMTRHFLFTQLHLAPLLAVLSGMGMDRILQLGRFRKWEKRHTIMLSVIGATILAAIYLAYYMVEQSGIATAQQGFLFSIAFIGLSLLVLFWLPISPKSGLCFSSFFLIALLDLLTFNLVAHKYTILSGRALGSSTVFVHAINVHTVLPDLPILDNYAQFASFEPNAYARWSKPSFYYPALHRYAIIGNKSFYDVMFNSTPRVRNMISGYSLPRLFLVEKAVEDPSWEISRRLLSTDRAERLVSNVVFLNDRVDIGKDTLVSEEALKGLERAPEVRVTEELTFHSILPSMVSSNITLEKGSISDLFTGGSLDIIVSKKVLNPEDNWWIQIDLGSGGERVVNFVRAHGESPFAGRVTFLDASHDGKGWERVGYLTAMDYERTPPDNKDWHTLNEESYRYYRIIIKQGDLPIEGRHLPQLKLGHEHRRLVSDTPRRFSAGVPLLRFVNGGLTNDKRYYIFSYYLPREAGIDFTTEPSQRFGYIYKLRWIDERGEVGDLLRPTWKDNWHSDNLFQLSYKVDGYLSINIPADKAIEFRKRILDITIESIETGVRVIDYGANTLRVLVNQSRPTWLYYADTWDEYWKARVNGKPTPVYRANLQFKAVYVPPGRQVIELKHKPTTFFRLIILSYLLQFVVLVIWIKTWGKGSKPEVQ